MSKFDVTKQFQKTLGSLLESIDDVSYIAVQSGEINEGFERAKALVKKEFWNMHDIIKLNVENELLKNNRGGE